MRCGRDQNGIALVVTLLALVLITAMVVEFSYGVHTGTNNLYNWRDSQRLSIMAKSGVNVTARFLKDFANTEGYATRSEIEMPVGNPFEDFQGTIIVRIEDENAKFNINTIISPDGVRKTYDSFVRLLTLLNLDVKIADRIADWIDVNSNARVSGSESGAKNAYLNSADELLLIHGIAREDYDKLLPYITVHGSKDNLYINVNRAKIPVLRSMSDAMKEETAKSIINQREFMPFGSANDFIRRTDIFQLDTGIYAVTEGNDFLMQVAASSGGLKRIIETVLNIDKAAIEYWKEY